MTRLNILPRRFLRIHVFQSKGIRIQRPFMVHIEEDYPLEIFENPEIQMLVEENKLEPETSKRSHLRPHRYRFYASLRTIKRLEESTEFQALKK